MYNQTTNFFGRDPMQWWIGQVTDPDKGEWGDAYEKVKAINGEDVYGFRCRVRIVGYHGNDTDLPDKDLPLAHILLPSNTTTVGGCGRTVQYQGGEVVVGFFLDGEDGQQPIIFGTLFKQTFVKDGLTSSMFNRKNQIDFIPYTPPKVRQRSGKHRFFSESPWPGGFSDGEAVKLIASKQMEAATNITVPNFSPCEDNEISKISETIKSFTRKMETLQQLNEQSTYVDPIYGGIVDVQSEIKIASNRIHNSMTKLVRRGRSWLIQETLDKLDKTMENKVDKFNQVVLGQATNALTSIIFCNIEKIQDGLLDYLSKSLENMIGQVLDVPTCGVENFMSDMFGQINNIMDTSLGSMFDQLNNIQGGGIALPSETFSKAIKFANILTNVLDCDKVNCPESQVFSSKNGVSKGIEENFDNIIDKAGLNSKTTALLEKIDDAIEASPSAPDCNTNVLKCGPPKVDFIGGGGQGVSGKAVVNAVGQIIGVAINGSGFGFKEPPLLSFSDGCDKGYSAGGYPKMGPVSIVKDENGNNVLDDDGNPVTVPDPNGTELGVVGAVINNPGQEYLPNTTETDLDGNVKEVTPDPNGNYDGETSFVTSLEDVIVENTGFGYDDNDTASVENGSIASAGDTLPGDATSDTIQKPGQAQVELKIQDGLVVGASVVNGGFGFTKLPEILINSDTGAGAKLSPVLKFTRIDDASQLAQITQDAVVTVISCIDK